MRVKALDAKEEALKFLLKATGTMPTTGHKFVSVLMLTAAAPKVEQLLQTMAGEDGCIDTDDVRRMFSQGFAATGDKVTFTIGDESMKWILKPVNVTFSKADVEEAIAGLEALYRR